MADEEKKDESYFSTEARTKRGENPPEIAELWQKAATQNMGAHGANRKHKQKVHRDPF
ncbi:MAG: hypothetical protein V4474_00375 [Patescibacteria group bacterium]